MKVLSVAKSISILSLVLVLSGCSNSNQAELERLKVQVSQLESENQELKTRLSRQDAATEFFKTLAKQADRQNAPLAPATPLGQPSGLLTNSGDAAAAAAPVAATPASPPAAAPAHPHFNDLTDVAQRPMIEELTALGVFDGMQDQFKPNEQISRAEYAKLLFNSYNALMPQDKQIHFAASAPPQFSDLSPDHPCYKYIQALSAAGFSVGYEDKTFRPDKPITREEMISMKIGVDCGKSYDPYRGQMAFVWKFSDSKDVDERFTGYIHQDYYVSGPYGSNIQRAFGKIGVFHPKYAATRAEAAGTLWQIGQWGTHGHTASAILEQSRSQT